MRSKPAPKVQARSSGSFCGCCANSSSSLATSRRPRCGQIAFPCVDFSSGRKNDASRVLILATLPLPGLVASGDCRAATSSLQFARFIAHAANQKSNIANLSQASEHPLPESWCPPGFSHNEAHQTSPMTLHHGSTTDCLPKHDRH